jgi:MFS family permease
VDAGFGVLTFDETSPTSVNRNDRAIVGLVTLAHAMVHTFELSIPILMTEWLEAFPVTKATLGLVVGAGYALFGIGALPGGVLADVIGSRRLIAACLAGMAGSFLLLSLAPSMIFIALALMLWGVAASVYHPSGLTLISKGVTERGEGLAYHGIAGNLGIALGPLVTTLLLLVFDWQTTAALLVVPALVGTVVALRIDVDETAAVEVTDGGRPQGDPVTSVSEFLEGTKGLFVGGFVFVFGVVMMSGLYYRGVLTFLPDVIAGFDAVTATSVFGVSMEPSRYVYVGFLTVGMAGQYVGGTLSDRVRPSAGIVGTYGVLAVLAVCFVPVANAGLLPLLALAALLGFFLFLVQPIYQAAVAELTPAGTRGLSYGFVYFGTFGVGAAGGAIAGVLLTYANEWGLFLFLAVVAATASILGIVLLTRE